MREIPRSYRMDEVQDASYITFMKSISESGEYTNALGEPALGIASAVEKSCSLMFDLANGFPLITSRKMDWARIFEHACEDIKNEKNFDSLVDAIRNSTCKPYYLLDWTPTRFLSSSPETSGPFPCQFYVHDGAKKTLHCTMTIECIDAAIRLPVFMANAALLVHLIAKECGIEAGKLRLNINYGFIYGVHLNTVRERLYHGSFPSPKLVINEAFKDRATLDPSMLSIVDYEFHPEELDS